MGETNKLGKNPSLRIPVSIVVQVAGQESTLLFFSQNISMTGIFLESETRLPDDQLRLADEVSLFFFLPTSAGVPVATRAKVVRREEVKSFKGEAVHALALEFINFDVKDQERLRLFIADYETELEDAVAGEEREQVEITDPQSIVAALVIGEQVIFEPRSSNDYFEMCHDVFELEKAIEKRQDVNLKPNQLLIMEGLEAFSKLDRRRIQELYWIEKPVLRDKILLNIYFMRLKINCEAKQLLAILQTSAVDETKLAYLENYVVAVSYEADRLHEAAHMLGQKLVADEQWDDFKEVNGMRAELDKAVHLFKEQMAPILAQRHSRAEPKALGQPIIDRLNIESCLLEIQEMIPDPEEEKDPFPNGASGEDIRLIWDTISSISDEARKTKLYRALALRRQVRDTLFKCIAKGDALLNHRSEVTEIYRQDAKTIKEMVAELMAIDWNLPKERDVAVLVVRLLEALAFQFGKLVRTIPSRLLSQEEVETVRYRSTAYRKISADVAPFWRRLQRQTLVMIMAIFAVAVMSVTLVKQHHETKARKLPITLIEELQVIEATLDHQGILRLTIQPLAWQQLSPQFRQERLRAIEKLCGNEGADHFVLINDKGALLAYGIKHNGQMVLSQLAISSRGEG